MYMADDDIRARSRRIEAICDATPEDLEVWKEEAFDLVNDFCQQDFTFEKQATKTVRGTRPNTSVYLPKPLSGDVTILDDEDNVLWSHDGEGRYQRAFEIVPGSWWLADRRGNTLYPTPDAYNFTITGDWGFHTSKTVALTSYVNDLVAAYDAHRVHPTAHNVNDTTNVTTLPAATDSASAIALLNELKSVVNSHMGDTVVHTNADTETITTSDATDETSAEILGKAVKEKLNLHMARDADSDPAIHLEADEDSVMMGTIDFVSSVLPRNIRRVFLRVTQRIAMRDDPEDHWQQNMPYANETLGDNYTYDLSNGTLRNLIRPDEANMLRPYVNRGRIAL